MLIVRNQSLFSIFNVLVKISIMYVDASSVLKGLISYISLICTNVRSIKGVFEFFIMPFQQETAIRCN